MQKYFYKKISSTKFRLVAKFWRQNFSTNQLLPRETDVVVIGGGSLGCNTLYHLTTLGVKNCVLVERAKITAGTTWHTAGLVWRLRPSDVDIELLAHTRNLNKYILEEETGQTTGWIENGGLFIANNAQRLNEYKRLMTLGKCYDVESFVLTPSETKKLYPLMNVEDLYGTLYSPGDGLIDSSTLCATLVKAAKQRGATVVEDCAVTGMQLKTNEFGSKQVESVQTASGSIRCRAVVDCAGAWSSKVGRMVGVNVPLLAMKHAYVVTDKIEGIRNMPNVRDHDASVYLKLQGDALAVGGYEPNPIFCEPDVEDNFAFGLYDLDWNVFDVHIKGAVNRVPILKTIGIKSEICGPESFTPDHKPLMGESLEVRGFYLGCGFNSAGMMLGGGCGRELAKWIVQGRPELHMHNYDIRRFASQLTNDQSWLKQRSHESYVNNYQIVFPNDEPLAGRPKRIDPLYQTLLDQGCVFQERLGWERPAWFATDQRKSPMLPYDYYGSYGNKKHVDYMYHERIKMDHTFEFPENHDIIGQECINCRKNVAVFDMSYFGKFFLSGPQAERCVEWIFTNDIVRKPTGSTVYTCMLNDRGGVEADLTVSVMDGASFVQLSQSTPSLFGTEAKRVFYVAAGGAIAEHVKQHILTEIERNAFKVSFKDMTEQMSLISVQGPKSRSVIQKLINDSSLLDDLQFSQHRIAQSGERSRFLLLRLSFVGELGYELHVPNDSAIVVYQALMEAGREFGIKNAGYRAIDSLSLEKGYRLWGTDLRMTDTPLEAGLSFTCKLKTDKKFRGRPALEAQVKKGLMKKMVTLTIDKHTPLWGLETVFRNNVAVGFVRRADFGFTVQKSIAHAYLSSKKIGEPITQSWLKDGTYEIESMGERYPATLHTIPLFDPKNNRLKGLYENDS